jgi:hypothetical protein
LKEVDGGWSQEADEKTVDQPAAAPAEPAAAAVVSAAAEAAVPAAAEAVVPAAAAGQLEQKGTNSASGGLTESLKIS